MWAGAAEGDVGSSGIQEEDSESSWFMRTHKSPISPMILFRVMLSARALAVGLWFVFGRGCAGSQCREGQCAPREGDVWGWFGLTTWVSMLV